MAETLKDLAVKFIESAKSETNPTFRDFYLEKAGELLRGQIEVEKLKVTTGSTQIIIERNEGDIMDKKYDIKAEQIGAVGDDARAEGNIFLKQAIADTLQTDNADLIKELQTVLEKYKTRSSDSTVPDKLTGAIALSKKGDSQEALKEVHKVRAEIEAVTNADETPKLNSFVKQTSPDFIDIEQKARILPWKRLDPDEFTINAEKIGDNEIKATLRFLERYGIARLRLSGQYPDEEILRSYFELIGQVAGVQNDFPDEIKTIRPKLEVDPNTGDSARDLGFHVDGTQAEDQPALLAFQYVKTADFGGNSRFVDLASVIKDLPADRKDALLFNLSRKDAAVFDKKDMRLETSIFHFPDETSLACRIRFDDVIKCIKECREDYEYLGNAVYNKYEIKFKPNPGDIIIFDNWRVMHARSEIYGDAQRVHRRVWMNALNTEHQDKYNLGIRPLPEYVIAEMKKQNGL